MQTSNGFFSPRRHGGTEKGLEEERITGQIIGAAIDVHRELGPGLLESMYERCLAHELTRRAVRHQKQVCVPIIYKGEKLEFNYKIDLVVEGRVVVEAKAVDSLLPVHKAQLLTYLKLTGYRVGLLLNFNTEVMKDGVVRMVL
jgi:GxxExxY protein